jgi:hypothetical protein
MSQSMLAQSILVSCTKKYKFEHDSIFAPESLRCYHYSTLVVTRVKSSQEQQS